MNEVSVVLGQRGMLLPAWPVYFITLLILLALSGCAASTTTSAVDLAYTSYSDARNDAFRTVNEMRNRLMVACAGIDPTRLNANTPYLVGYASEMRGCIREKLTEAFANSEGVAHCASKEDISGYIVCISLGDWLNLLRHGAGSPKSLSPEEWLDTERALTNTVNELTALSLMRCAGRSQSQLADCQAELLVEALSTSTGDLAACRGEIAVRLRCVAYKSVASYLHDKTMLIW
jgi:hypothetical protein